MHSVGSSADYLIAVRLETVESRLCGRRQWRRGCCLCNGGCRVCGCSAAGIVPGKQHNIMKARGGSSGSVLWEYQELVIPLGIYVLHWRTPDYVGAATPLIQPMIAAALADAASEGWHADEPTDFPTLFSRSRVRTTNTFIRWRVTSATIRLTRLIGGERLVPHG